MTTLRHRITRVDATVWFGCALVLAAAGYVVRESSPLPGLIPHALILAGVWRGSRTAWALLVTISAVWASLFVIFGVASLFVTTLTVEVNDWSVAADGLALLFLAAYRERGRRSALDSHARAASAPA